MQASPPQLTTRRRVAYSLAMLAIVLVTAELAVRLLGQDLLREAHAPPSSPIEGAPNLRGNPYLLWEIAPGVRHEMGVTVEMNSFGFRGPEVPQAKPLGVKRVMALGDSSVFGFGVEDEEVFTALLDSRLGSDVEVMNAAIPGYSTYQSINLMEMRGFALEPDLLILGGLWSDNNFDSFVDKDLLAAYSAFGSRAARNLRRSLQTSSFFTILDYKLRVARKFPEYLKVGWMVGRGEPIGQRRVEINDYARNLELLVQLAHENGGEVMFLLLANEEDLLPPSDSPAAWDPYRDVMRDTARRHGYPLVDLPTLFRESGHQKPALFLDEMHPTALGHRIMADGVQRWLVERGWAEGSPLRQDPERGSVPRYQDVFVEQPSASPGPERGSTGAPRASAILKGTLVVPDGAEGLIQLDVVTGQSSPPRTLGSARLSGSGSFTVRVDDISEAIRFVAYLNPAASGPAPGDVKVLFPGTISIPREGLDGITLDLREGKRIVTFMPDGTTPVGDADGEAGGEE